MHLVTSSQGSAASVGTCDSTLHAERERVGMTWKLCVQEVTYPVVTPEVAFTGDTSGAVFSAPGFEDALAAKLLIIEATFLSEDVKLEHAQVCHFSGTH